MKQIGEYNGIPVITSPYVDKGHVYLMNPDDMYRLPAMVFTRRQRIKHYFKHLWEALRGL